MARWRRRPSAPSTESAAPSTTGSPPGSVHRSHHSARRAVRAVCRRADLGQSRNTGCGNQFGIPAAAIEVEDAGARRGARIGEQLTGQMCEQRVLGAGHGGAAAPEAAQPRVHRRQVSAVEPLSGDPVDRVIADRDAQRARPRLRPWRPPT